MAKKSKDVVFDVSGGSTKIDERGKLRNRDADEADRGSSGSKGKKKKKSKIEKHVPVVIEDNTYKAGQEKKKKKRKTSDDTEVVLPKKKKRLPVTIEGEVKNLPAVTKGSSKKLAKAQAAIEEYNDLPPPVDEFDAVIRAKFEAQVDLAARLEEQMEDRIYARDVYALNTVYNQIREMIADLRASRDVSAQVDEIQAVVILPYHRSVGQALSDVFYHTEGAIRKFVRDPDLQQEIIKKLKNVIHESAVELQGEYSLATERVRKALL